MDIEWNDIVGTSTGELFSRAIRTHIPRVLAATCVLILGVVLAWMMKRLAVRLQNKYRLETLYSETGIADFLGKIYPGSNACMMVANLFFWLTISGVAIAALEILGLTVLSRLIGSLLSYLPNLLGGLLIIIAGIYAAKLSKRALERRIRHPLLRKSAIPVVSGMVIFTASSIALYHTGVARGLLAFIYVALIGTMGLVILLSFGLASAELGKKVLAGRVLLRPTLEERPLDLTPKQQELLGFLREFVARSGHSPLIREIQEALGDKSTKSVAYKLAQLQRKGYIKREKGKHRGIQILRGDPMLEVNRTLSGREAEGLS